MAIAPERTGIGIRRYFTTPGTDPYDTVTWERRDARITHWATGAVAFEQLGVEVPSGWSVNATNILAQKYFRGTLGTPEREWSLKQVADRVAGAVVAWGQKDGYFADKQEADAFEAELKWLIIHQRAAFNSPVWFNIGVAGVPQQASACQPYWSLVNTPEGLVPIGKLVESGAVGAKVYDAHGVTKVVAVKANGRKPVLRLHTKAGHQLDVTADHLVWRHSGVRTGRFVAAGTLRPGDQLTWHRTEAWGSGEINSRDVAEAALAGWLQSDGFVGRYEEGTNRSLTIEAMTVTDAELAWVTAALDKVFPDTHRKETRVVTQSTTLDCRRTRLYGRSLLLFVERWGLRTRGQEMTVPPSLYEAPLPVVQAYLRSIFQAEGYVSLRGASSCVGLDMISEGIVRGAQRLLARFGIFSRVRFKEDRRSNRKGCWSLSIRSEGDRRLFDAEIGFIDPVKAEKLERSFDVVGRPARNAKVLEIEAVEELGEMDVYDIQTESGEYLSEGLRVHNCFILSVDDSMDSILNWYVEEGRIFKGGSGAGINLSRIRSSHEGLRGGGTASGPVSFMRGADASAGTIKSGGKTRRAAKMVILDAGHPDIEDFIWCKAIEERKARALRDSGFDMDLDGKDSHSIQYQNANNSVRVTDEFMHAVLDDKDWELKAISTGEVLKTMKARDLFRQIAKAAWECADPGMQFDTTINKWHTASNTARINGSNPCFTGDALVHTDKGLVSFRELFARANEGETFSVYTHDATNPDAPAQRLELTTPEAFMITGYNEVLKLRFDNGMEVRCTPAHRFFTTNRGYVEARDLSPEDNVKLLDLPAPAVNASYRLPITNDLGLYSTKGDHRRLVNLPEKWDEELAHYLGWMVGDGSVGASGTLSAVYRSPEDQAEILPRHEQFVTWLNGGLTPKASMQANGTVQLRLSRRPLAGFFAALGLTAVKGPQKRVPWSVFEAPTEIVAAFLRGLFDADGCVRRDDKKGSYVGLGSSSRELLVDVQRLLTTFGVSSTIWKSREAGASGFTYRRVDGTVVTYKSNAQYDLRITRDHLPRFAQAVGFDLPSKSAKLEEMIADRVRGFYKSTSTAKIVDRAEDGYELTYNLSEPRNHSYIVNGLIVRNCSEYMHIDNSACNLASLNLLTFIDEDGNFDVEGFKAAVEVVFTGQEILVGNADYPTKAIGDNSRRFRQLGLGYANLGALLMAEGLPYDSDGGRAWAGALTALMTGHAYAVSARTAARMGPFAGYHENREPMLEVLRMHRAEVAKIDEELVPPELLSAAQESWDTAVETAELYGVRNSQATVLAPTGCLVGGSLVPTERGLVRLASLGDPDGAKWQALGVRVASENGPKTAVEFYVNGLEPVVTVETRQGFRLQGTPQHRVKVVDHVTGQWEWKRLADVQADDMVPLALDQLFGLPEVVLLPPLPATAEVGHPVTVPQAMTADLAELVGYFMGQGFVTDKGLHFRATKSDIDVIEHLRWLGKSLFGLEATSAGGKEEVELTIGEPRLAHWWAACGFTSQPGGTDEPNTSDRQVPGAVLGTNDREIYSAFLRGLSEAAGETLAGQPKLTVTSLGLARDVQALMLALGYPTSLGMSEGPAVTVRVLNRAWAEQWSAEVGFIGGHKQSRVELPNNQPVDRDDYVPLNRELVERLAPAGDALRRTLMLALDRGRVSRRDASELYELTGDREIGHLLRFFYDTVAKAELGGEELTYDLSVPSNVTYVANGFVSHNTIGLLMDCDTTGVEPDLGLVKTKKLVGGGTMSIVNQTVPRALRRLGYSDDQIGDITAYIDEHKSIIGAPHLSPDHLAVFACSMGDNTIHYRGHVKMMAAAQPFISGAISKCVTGDTLVTTEDGLVAIGSLYDGEEPGSFRHQVMEVASLDGTSKTDAFYYGGQRPVRTVVLRSGMKVTGTPNHRLLTAGPSGLQWRRLDQISEGEYVATRYGAEMWSPVPARLAKLAGPAEDRSPRDVTVPDEMSEELAFFLGAYASQGRATPAGTLKISHSEALVLERAREAAERCFGVAARVHGPADRGRYVEVSSKVLGELLEKIGLGASVSSRRVPDAILRSPRHMVVAFVQGLAQGASVTGRPMAKWALAIDAPQLLDQLQAVFANLGVLTARTSEQGASTSAGEQISASGEFAQRVIALVPFLEPGKQAAALELVKRAGAQNSADVVPGVSAPQLLALVPARGSHAPAELCSEPDPRNRHVCRRTLERVAAVPGVTLPDWLQTVLDQGLHFSPVTSVTDSGVREVFDLSVPGSHSFVGNGIVNHNTVNMPEDVTVEDVEQLHIEAWQLGIKAVAIYRDNCKVAQPLATTKRTTAADVAATSAPEAHDAELALKVAELEKALQNQTTVVVKKPIREHMPRKRKSFTFSFRVADCEGYVTVGELEDGRPGEVFMKVSKQGSTLAGIMDAFAISVSLGLQHGVPLATFVRHFTNMRFEPAGMTDDPELRFASSLVDYIFRRLAVEYMSVSERVDLGILTVGERMQPTLPGVEEATIVDQPLRSELVEDVELRDSRPQLPSSRQASSPAAKPVTSDAPYCFQCGVQMQRAGSCFACSSCGTTSGCS